MRTPLNCLIGLCVSKKIKSNKKLQFLLIIALIIIIVLIFISGVFTTGTNTTKAQATIIDSYVDSLETRLSNTLSKVEGAGNVSVVITVESGMQTEIAMKSTIIENEKGVEKTETPVLVNGKPVVLRELYPKVVGVLIVAQGANKISVLTKIQEATISLLDIKLSQIEILTMK